MDKKTNTETLLKHMNPLYLTLFASFVSSIYNKNNDVSYEIAAQEGLFEPDLFLKRLVFVFIPLIVDYFIFMFVIRAFNNLSIQEQKDVEIIREKYQRATLTGTIDPLNSEYQEGFRRYKEIYQGKTNKYKNSFAYFVSKCFFNDLIVTAFLLSVAVFPLPFVPQIHFKLISYFFIGNTIYRTSSIMQRRLKNDISQGQNMFLSFWLPLVSMYFLGSIVYYCWFIGEEMSVLALFFFIYFFLILFETVSESERLSEIRKIVYLFLK